MGGLQYQRCRYLQFQNTILGSQVRYNSDFGAMHVDANDTAITFETINRSGSIIDTCRIENGPTASPEPIPQTGWSLLSVDSEELSRENGAAINAFDGNTSTIWHTKYAGGSPAHPHDIRIALGDTYQLDGFRYLPRQDGGDNGRIKKYAFYVSSDGSSWGSPIATGTSADNASEQEVLFAAQVTGAFARLVALSAYDDNPWN